MSGIECPVCTNVNGSGASKCDSGKVPKVTCPDGLDHCITLKGKMTVLTSTQDFEQKNCSNNASCDSASDYNGKNVNSCKPNRRKFHNYLACQFTACLNAGMNLKSTSTN